MASLPTQLPKWYTIEPDRERGWTPKTSDIIRKSENNDITQAWNGTFSPRPAKQATLCLKGLQIRTPIQVGSGSLPEGGILPAHLGGVPVVPGSSIRGALLHWLNQQWPHIPTAEQAFWQTLLQRDRQGWQPRQIRFENIHLKDLKPYPLNAQQNWQLFDQRENKLGVQWQVSPNPYSVQPDKFVLQVQLRQPPTPEQKKWLEQRLTDMLIEQGIGRGTASGFGRLSETRPKGTWEIILTGMKPCVQSHIPRENQNGEYRWSPQVLRACLRGYFHRLALSLLSPDQAQSLTDAIFGGLGRPAQLVMPSYIQPIGRVIDHNKGGENKGYVNIPAKVVNEEWRILVNCSEPFQLLIGHLLDLASRLGGLGPGWRRPPHVLTRFNGFRGSQFTVTAHNPELGLSELIDTLKQEIRRLARANDIPLPPTTPRPRSGHLISIWQGADPEDWDKIVHGVCSTQNNPDRPTWCGNSQHRPSGYAVRQYKDHCLITVFDPAVEATLQAQQFTRIWHA